MGDFTAIAIDFETTGLSPYMGDRTIEVGAVVIESNKIVGRFQSLMNPGMKISPFIESYTGITNQMVASAPPVAEVMHDLARFISHHPLVAHNASFDSRFLNAEFDRIGLRCPNHFACSMLSARRLYQDAPGYRLESLVKHKNIKTDGVHHRALADAEMTARLWIHMIADIKSEYEVVKVDFELMQRLCRVSKKKLSPFFAQFAKRGT